jgi:mitofissin-like protein
VSRASTVDSCRRGPCSNPNHQAAHFELHRPAVFVSPNPVQGRYSYRRHRGFEIDRRRNCPSPAPSGELTARTRARLTLATKHRQTSAHNGTSARSPDGRPGFSGSAGPVPSAAVAFAVLTRAVAPQPADFWALVEAGPSDTLRRRCGPQYVAALFFVVFVCLLTLLSPSLDRPRGHEAFDRLDVSWPPIPRISPRRPPWFLVAHLLPSRLTHAPVGIPRPSFKTDRASGENKDMNKWIDKYLGVGEWVMDQSVAIASSSGWFERTR